MSKTLMTATAAAALAMAPAWGQKDDGGDDGDAALVGEIKSLGEKVTKSHDQLKDDLAKLKADTGDKGKAFETFKSDVDERFTALNANAKKLEDLMKDFEQKAARSGPAGKEPRKSIGRQVVESETFKALDGSVGKRQSFKIDGALVGEKAITSLEASAGTLVDSQRLPGVITAPDRRMTIRGLIAQGRTNSNSVDFVKEKLFTNAAAVQAAEGDKKAESTLTYELENARVLTIAHFIKVSTQMLDDAPALASQIDARLRYGLQYREELQLLKGSGIGANLTGLITAAADYADPTGGEITGLTRIDVLRLAALQATVNEYAADGIVLNPIDWALIELLKDSQGRYIIGQPQGQMGAMLWNLPVAMTNAMDADDFLVGAFGQTAQIFDRQDAQIDISTENEDDFVKNLATVRGEQRLALAIYRDDALISGDFTTATADPAP